MTADPTRDEMLSHLIAAYPEADEFDRESAIYWFASDCHDGQWSNLYAALSASPYKPGILENSRRLGGLASECYASLETTFASRAAAK